jgi:hypothetical protein
MSMHHWIHHRNTSVHIWCHSILPCGGSRDHLVFFLYTAFCCLGRHGVLRAFREDSTPQTRKSCQILPTPPSRAAARKLGEGDSSGYLHIECVWVMNRPQKNSSSQLPLHSQSLMCCPGLPLCWVHCVMVLDRS